MKTLLACMTLMMGVLTTTSAQAVSAQQSVLKEIRSVDAAGDMQTRYIEAKLVIPGETIVYRLDVLNDQAEPVTDLVLTMPVPPEVIYVDGTAAREGAATLYSADGAKTFLPRDQLSVQSDDGAVRPASENDVTHVRWTLETPIAPGDTDALSFKAVLK